MHAQETKTTINQHTRSQIAHAKLKTNDSFKQYSSAQNNIKNNSASEIHVQNTTLKKFALSAS